MKFVPKRKNEAVEGRLAPRMHPSELSKKRTASSTRMYYRPVKSEPSTTVGKGKSSTAKPQRKVSYISSTQFSRLPSLLIVLAFFVLLFFASTLSGQVVVQANDSGYTYRAVEEYQQQASHLLSGSGLSQSKLLFRSDKYESNILELFPELESATALLPLGGRDLTLQIRTSTPLVKVQSADGDAKIINESGSLVVLKNHSNDTQQLPMLILDSSYTSSLTQGNQVLTQAEVDIIKLAIQEFTAARLSGAGVQGIDRIVVSITDGEMLVYLQGVPFYVKLSSYSQIEQQVGAAVATIIDLNSRSEPPLEYIDVRVPGRVYIK